MAAGSARSVGTLPQRLGLPLAVARPYFAAAFGRVEFGRYTAPPMTVGKAAAAKASGRRGSPRKRYPLTAG